MKDTIYFSHDYNAHLDQKIVKLRFKYWREWYWLFRATLEIMREDSDVVMRWCEIDANAYRLHYDMERYKWFILYCVEVWLLKYDKKDDVYYSIRLQTDVEYMREKSAKAKRSADARWSKRCEEDANALQTDSESYAINKGNDSINKNKVYRSFAHLSISVEENQKLLNEWRPQQILDSKYDAIENRKKNKDYKSLYLTTRKRLEKETKPVVKNRPETDSDLSDIFTLPWK